jgi:hypothetical protein
MAVPCCESRRQTLAFVVEITAFVMAVLLAWGLAARNTTYAYDDMAQTHRLAQLAKDAPGLLDKIEGVTLKAGGAAHYKPTQDVISVIMYHLSGSERWVRRTFAVYLGLSVLLALLLRRFLTGIGMPRYAAFLIAVLYSVHPAHDETFLCVQFASNTIGLLFLLAAAVIWFPDWKRAGDPRWVRALGGGVLLCLAVGCNPVLMATAPLALGIFLVGFQIRRSRSSLLTVARNGLFLLGGLATALVLRWAALGKLGSAKRYDRELSDLLSVFDEGKIARQIWKALFLLEPSGTARSKVNPPGAATWDFAAPLLSVDTAMILVVVMLLGVAALWFQHLPSAAGERQWGRRSLFVGLTFLASFVLPYAVWMKHVGTHRYSHVAALGIIILVVGLLARATWSKKAALPNGRLVTLVLLPILFVFIRIDREAARSIEKAHGLVQDWVSFISRDLVDEPEIKTFFVLGFPRVVGRIGVTSNLQSSFQFSVQRLVGRSMRIPGPYRGFFPKDMEPEDIRDSVAIYGVDRRGEIRRIQDPRQLDPVGPACFDLYALSMGRARNEVLQSQRFLRTSLRNESASYVQRYMCLLEHMNPDNCYIVRQELGRMAAPGPPRGVEPVEYGAFVEPKHLKRALLLAARVKGQLPQALLGMLEFSVVTGPTLVAAVGNDAAPFRLQRLLRLAASGAETTLGPALEALATLSPRLDENSLRSAVELEREGRKLAGRKGSASHAIVILERAEREYKAFGIHRPEVRMTRLRCRMALSPLDETGPLPSYARFPLSAELEFVRALAQGHRVTGVRLAAGPIATDQPRAESFFAAFIIVQNQGSQHLPGGVSPYAPRVLCEWHENGKSEPRFLHEALLPSGGVPAGHARRILLESPAPLQPGRYALKVTLRAEGLMIAELPQWIEVQVRE